MLKVMKMFHTCVILGTSNTFLLEITLWSVWHPLLLFCILHVYKTNHILCTSCVPHLFVLANCFCFFFKMKHKATDTVVRPLTTSATTATVTPTNRPVLWGVGVGSRGGGFGSIIGTETEKGVSGHSSGLSCGSTFRFLKGVGLWGTHRLCC